MTQNERTDLLLGTLDLLVLKVLELKPLHGLGVARRIEQVTRGEFQVKPGSLFPARRVKKLSRAISCCKRASCHAGQWGRIQGLTGPYGK